LKDHHRIAGEVPRLREIASRAEQHRGMAVVAAGVHQALRLRGVGKICLLLDRKRIHIGAKSDHLDLAIAGRLLTLDDADHAGLPETGRDLVAAKLPQAVGDESRGAVNVIEQLRLLMDVAAPSLDVGLQIGDAVDDGHGKLGSPA
jgi:hypothetical protein